MLRLPAYRTTDGYYGGASLDACANTSAEMPAWSTGGHPLTRGHFLFQGQRAYTPLEARRLVATLSERRP